MIVSEDLARVQNEWLGEARARILRNAEIAKRKAVLDLGAGYGVVIPELTRRSAGLIVALDLVPQVLKSISGLSVCGNAAGLPFRSNCFDLVYSQNFLLWAKPLDRIASEVNRILASNGVWILLEPDYGGMLEYPEDIQIKDVWISALSRDGADPFIGRKLPSLLQKHGFETRTELLPRIAVPAPERFDLLSEMDLTLEEAQVVEKARHASLALSHQQIAHLPYFLITATVS